MSDDLSSLASAAGLRRVHVLAWRDLADPEAGGSEVHVHEITRRWAEAGVEVTMRTSRAEGLPATERRAGMTVVRRGGRMTVFPRAVAAELAGRHGPRDALVEIWNGVPWFSPRWARGPRLIWLHHIHGPMWDQILPAPAARLGRALETRLAPPHYRGERVVTLAESSRAELVHRFGWSPDRVEVVPPGLAADFTPGGERSAVPLVVAVGRLVPVKRHELLLDAVARARRSIPDLQLVIVGEGFERAALEARVRALGAEGWVRLPGRVGDGELVDLYRRAWLVASTSLAEGWGMTLTEAAACGTPAVATDIAGHRDAVRHGVSGLLAPDDGIAAALVTVFRDERLRARLTAGALARADELSWDRASVRILGLLTEQVHRARCR